MNLAGGVFAMSVTPFDADGEISEDLLRAHVDWLATAGVGICLCSQGSGEGDLLRADEKRRVYEIGVEAASGRVPVWAAGIGLAGATAHIVALARSAEAAGVDAVYVLGPRPSPAPPRPVELGTYFRSVVDAVGCPVVVSDNSYLAGYAFPPELLGSLPGIAAVVVAGADADPGAVEVDVPVLVGNTELAHLPGVAGLLCAEANVVPEVAAARDYERMIAVKRVCTRHGPRSLKAALTAIGRDAGTVRPPYLPLSASARVQISEALGDARSLRDA